MNLIQRNDSSIANLETHLRQYGYVGSFPQGSALPAQGESTLAAGQPTSRLSHAVPTGNRLGPGDEPSEYCSAGSPSPQAWSTAVQRGPTRGALVMLPSVNMLLDGNIGAQLQDAALYPKPTPKTTSRSAQTRHMIPSSNADPGHGICLPPF